MIVLISYDAPNPGCPLFSDAPNPPRLYPRYMSERMVEVTPRMIQDIMYRVVLQYLGWVVLWGCVFGGVLGATFQAAGFAPSYENW